MYLVYDKYMCLCIAIPIHTVQCIDAGVIVGLASVKMDEENENNTELGTIKTSCIEEVENESEAVRKQQS